MYVRTFVSDLLLQCVLLDSKLENMIGTLRSEVSTNQEVEEGASPKKVLWAVGMMLRVCQCACVCSQYSSYVACFMHVDRSDLEWTMTGTVSGNPIIASAVLGYTAHTSILP